MTEVSFKKFLVGSISYQTKIRSIATLCTKRCSSVLEADKASVCGKLGLLGARVSKCSCCMATVPRT